MMAAFVGSFGSVSRGRRVVVCVGPASGSPAAGGSTVLERKAQTEKAKVDPGKRYNVLVFGDSGQTREFITQGLLKCLPGMKEDTAKEIAERAKKVGKAVVGAWIFEMAEAYCDALRSNGLVADIELE